MICVYVGAHGHAKIIKTAVKGSLWEPFLYDELVLTAVDYKWSVDYKWWSQVGPPTIGYYIEPDRFWQYRLSETDLARPPIPTPVNEEFYRLTSDMAKELLDSWKTPGCLRDSDLIFVTMFEAECKKRELL